jgi:hypothetical protein
VDEEIRLDGAPADPLGALGPVLDVQQAAFDDGRVDRIEHIVGGQEEVTADERRRAVGARRAQLLRGARKGRARGRRQLPADELDGQQ